MSEKHPLVGIVVPTNEDKKYVKAVSETFDKFNVSHEVRSIGSKSRASKYSREAIDRGLQVIIAADTYDYLPRLLAKNTILPILAIPIERDFVDPIHTIINLMNKIELSKEQPVCYMGLSNESVTSGSINTALFAVQILASTHPELSIAVEKYRSELAQEVFNSVLE